MDRLEAVRQTVDEILRQCPDIEEGRCGFVHLYGVSAVCVQLALKRGLDVELCSLAGMLHDVWTYKMNDTHDHARLSALEAVRIMRQTGAFTEEEVAVVCDAIARHSDKGQVHGDLAELLKDADIFQHYIYNPALGDVPADDRRLPRVLGELGLA